MTLRNWTVAAVAAVSFSAGIGFHMALAPESVQAMAANRVFELRTYTAPEGKLEALNARFRDHTIRIFKKHDMNAIGYWTPQDQPGSKNTLIYILAHPSREAATKNWAAFMADPEWVKAKADSEVNGRLTTQTPASVFLDPTDFSPIK